MTEIGTAFRRLPNFKIERDLEAFDGPILTQLRVEEGGVFLQKWCSYEGAAVRTLIVRSDQRAIAEYLAKRMTMLDLLTVPSADVGFLVDHQAGKGLQSVRLVEVSSLPRKYLPKPGALHDESLRPDWSTTPHSFLVDTNWDAKLLFELERLYLTVYAFNYFMAPGTGAQLPEAAYHYILEGGWAYYQLCQLLRRFVPPNDNARSTGLAAASPGVLTIAAPTPAANRIVAALTTAARTDTIKAYDLVHAWSRFPAKRAAEIPPGARDDLRRLSEMLGIDMSKLVAQGSEDQALLLTCGKIVAAYFRQLWRLLDPTRQGVEFLASGLVREEASAPESVYDDEPDEEGNDF